MLIFGCRPRFDEIFCAIGFTVVVDVAVVAVDAGDAAVAVKVDAGAVAAVVDVRLVGREAFSAGAVVLAEPPCAVTVGAFALAWVVGVVACGLPWVVVVVVCGLP